MKIYALSQNNFKRMERSNGDNKQFVPKSGQLSVSASRLYTLEKFPTRWRHAFNITEYTISARLHDILWGVLVNESVQKHAVSYYF